MDYFICDTYSSLGGVMSCDISRSKVKATWVIRICSFWRLMDHCMQCGNQQIVCFCSQDGGILVNYWSLISSYVQQVGYLVHENDTCFMWNISQNDLRDFVLFFSVSMAVPLQEHTLPRFAEAPWRVLVTCPGFNPGHFLSVLRRRSDTILNTGSKLHSIAWELGQHWLR